MNVAIYSRKSKITDKGESIENQIELCTKYIESHYNNVDNVYKYEDEGFSGKNIDRPQFQSMMFAAKHKKFSVIICYRLDRISRNITDFSKLVDELKKLGIDFVSIKEQFDTTSPMGRAMMFISSVFAQLERETTAERIRDNMLELSKTGRWLGGMTPLGFNVRKTVENGKIVSYLEINNGEMETVKLIYDKYLEYESLFGVNKYMLQNNVQGRKWTTSKISFILKSPYYVKSDGLLFKYLKNKDINVSGAPNGNGMLPYNTHYQDRKFKPIDEWIYVVGQHKGIIDSITWIKIQEKLSKNKSIRNLGKTNKCLLTGLLRCGNCGALMVMLYGSKRKDGTRPIYYKCGAKQASGSQNCNIENIKADVIDNMVIEQLKLLELDKENISIYNNPSNSKMQLEALHGQLKKNEKMVNNLVEKLAHIEGVAADFLINKINDLAKENKETKNMIAAVEIEEDKESVQNINKDIIISTYKKFIDTLDASSMEDKQKLLKGFVKEIRWYGKDKDIDIELL